MIRRDIQILRGWAILLVLLYHADVISWLYSGWLGVDLFFVLSGYLITGMVAREMAEGTFSFTAFYARRAKRLLPAAYLVIALCLLLAPLVLVGNELWDFTRQVAGAVTLSANIALWLQTGYFEGSAALKPLLHFWSLAIEEQYYLLLPLCLFLAPRKLWGWGALAVSLASLCLCLVLVGPKPGATFYLLPTRAWELGIGSVAALTLDGSRVRGFAGKLSWFFLPVLLVLPLLPLPGSRPGYLEFAICLATAFVLVSRNAWLEQSRLLAPLAWLGDVSYSLYLVHWPVFAFLANVWVGPVPAAVRWMVVLGSLGAAWLSYRFVELPCRRIQLPARKVFWIAGVGALMLLAGAAYLNDRAEGRVRAGLSAFRQANLGLAPACEFGDRYSAVPQCQSGPIPGMLVWGDSFAMHLVDGLTASADYGVAQATRSVCAAAHGLASYQPSGYFNRDRAKGCLQFTASVASAIPLHPEWEVVVLGSPFGMYLEGSLLSVAATTDVAAVADVEGSEDLAVAAFTMTVRNLRAQGKRVLIVAPPPNTNFDIGLCLERRALGLPVLGADAADCSIDAVRYRQLRGNVHRFLDRLSREAEVPVYRMDEFLCDSRRCITSLNGVPLYRDSGHLSVEGSRVLGKAMNWGAEWWALAR